MSTVPPTVSVTPNPVAAIGPSKPAAKKHDHITFDDILDIINPLQHIPVISTLYRRFTGDKMSPIAEIFGGALYGGVIGAVSSVADVLWTQARGKDFGQSVMGWLGFDKKSSATQLAQAKTPPVQVVQKVPPKPTGNVPGLPALMDSLQRQGVSPDIAARAAAAYRRALGLTEDAKLLPAPAL